MSFASAHGDPVPTFCQALLRRGGRWCEDGKGKDPLGGIQGGGDSQTLTCTLAHPHMDVGCLRASAGGREEHGPAPCCDPSQGLKGETEQGGLQGVGVATSAWGFRGQ